jgi:MFS family permease
MGLVGPIRQGYINAHIPSKQRATVLSLDSFFSDAGGAMGQPVFGWLARSISTPVTYIIGGVITSIAAPLYKRSGRNTEIALDVSSAVECARDGTCEPIESVKI